MRNGPSQSRLPASFQTNVQRLLQDIAERESRGAIGFLALSTLDEGVVWNGNVATISPRASLKVSGDDRRVEVGSEDQFIYAAAYWPVSAFTAVSGGRHSPMSVGCGTCVHPDPADDTTSIVTFLASRDTWRYGKGWVVPVSLGALDFEQHPFVPWLYRSKATVSIVADDANVITKSDLLVPPVKTQDDETMRMVAGAPDQAVDSGSASGRQLPMRGPHHDFDPAYACGATGGQLAIAVDFSISTIEVTPDFFSSLG